MKPLQVRADWVDPEDQRALGREAREFYATKVLANRSGPRRKFDAQMFSLFDSIEACRDDIDTKLSGLHVCWIQESIWDRTKDGIKLTLLVNIMGSWAASEARRLKTDSARQMTLNINRLHHITWALPTPAIAKSWVGPALAPPPAVAELTPWDDAGVTIA